MGRDWLGQSGKFRAKCLSLFAFCLLAGASSLAAHAETPTTPLPKQIGLLENRFFYHLYVQDPIEKRLERLELLVFGGTQAGSNEERLARLKTVVADRDTTSAQSAPQANKAPSTDSDKTPSTGQDKAKQSSGQYPILNTLEWRLLKKTYPDDSMDARLERMETKVFGQASPAMAYIDRVERLKKTVGVGVAEEAPKGKLGPRPKARPRLDDGNPTPDGFGMMPTIPPNPFNGQGGQRGMSPYFGDFNTMFRQLDKQMQEMMRMPPGHYEYDPNTGEWTESDTGRKLSPDTAPPQAQPKKKQKPPPYYDPNSI